MIKTIFVFCNIYTNIETNQGCHEKPKYYLLMMMSDILDFISYNLHKNGYIVQEGGEWIGCD